VAEVSFTAVQQYDGTRVRLRASFRDGPMPGAYRRNGGKEAF
jgi:hypothetical protein